MGQVAHFRGILPSSRTTRHSSRLQRVRADQGRAGRALRVQDGPGDVILSALWPVRDYLDRLLARGDEQRALGLAYRALSRVCNDLAAFGEEELTPGQTRVHELLVELQKLPTERGSGGRLVDRGTAVEVLYRNWTLDNEEGEPAAEALAGRGECEWFGDRGAA